MSSAFGTGATVNDGAQRATALGLGATVWGSATTGGLAVGDNCYVYKEGGVCIGKNAKSSGLNTIVLSTTV